MRHETHGRDAIRIAVFRIDGSVCCQLHDVRRRLECFLEILRRRLQQCREILRNVCVLTPWQSVSQSDHQRRLPPETGFFAVTDQHCGLLKLFDLTSRGDVECEALQKISPPGNIGRFAAVQYDDLRHVCSKIRCGDQQCALQPEIIETTGDGFQDRGFCFRRGCVERQKCVHPDFAVCVMAQHGGDVLQFVAVRAVRANQFRNVAAHGGVEILRSDDQVGRLQQIQAIQRP